MEEDEVRGVLYTIHDELNFSDGDAYPNEEGNICLKFDDKSFVVLTPLMAKRLNRLLDEAIRSSLGMTLSEE